MAKQLKGFRVDTYGTRTAGKWEIQDKVDELQAVVGGRCFTIASRKIGGEYFDIICDDEGLLRDAPLPSAADPNGTIMLVGNLFICRHRGPDLISLKESDYALIKQNLRHVFYKNMVLPIIICEY